MQPNDIKQLIKNHLTHAEVHVVGDDGVHFEAHVVSNEFNGISRVSRERMVHDALGKHFETGAIHALSIKTFTPEEWNHKNN